MRKKIKNVELFKIYFNYCFSIKTLVIIILSLAILAVCLIALCHFDESISFYLKNFESIHSSFIAQAVLLIEIINAFIIAFISTIIINDEKQFDSIFISYIPRAKIAISKIFSISAFMLIYIFLELLIISLIGFFQYPYFNCIKESLNVGAYLIILSFLEISISFLLCVLINNSFSTIISFIIFMFYSFIKNKLIISLENYNKLLPVISNGSNSYALPYFGIIFCFIALFGFCLIYNYKNI